MWWRHTFVPALQTNKHRVRFHSLALFTARMESQQRDRDANDNSNNSNGTEQKKSTSRTRNKS
jgi:hypothetical protein